MHELECLYCGHKWIDIGWYQPDDLPRCYICHDTHLKAREIKENPNYYIGCPPFPSEVD